MGLQAGKLDRPIIIQAKGTSRDSFGATIETWGTWAKCFAEFTPMAGGESFEATQLTAAQTATFKIRYRAGVLPTMRIIHDERAWDIINIAEPDRRVTLLITAVSREVGSGRKPVGG